LDCTKTFIAFFSLSKENVPLSRTRNTLKYKFAKIYRFYIKKVTSGKIIMVLKRAQSHDHTLACKEEGSAFIPAAPKDFKKGVT
jgi:hypothetical protein